MVDLAVAAEHDIRASARSDVNASSRLTAEALTGAAAYDSIAAEWDVLAKRQQAATIFQSPQFLSVWAKHFATGPGSKLVTIVVRDCGRPLLIWPLLVERHGLVRVARGAGAPVSQYDEILVDPDCDLDAAFAAARDALKRSARPDLLLVERVRADGPLRRALRDASPEHAEGAPYADLSDGVDKLMASLKSRVARQQKKRVRRFEEAGHVAFEVALDAEQAERWLAEAMALKYEWLRSTGRVSRAFVKSDTGACLGELARTQVGADASPRLLISRLTLDGQTAAVEMGFCDRGAYHLYLGAFSPEMGKYGPGNILTAKILEWCGANGFRRYDMLSPRTRNKGEWQSGEVEVHNFTLPVTSLGRGYVSLVLKGIIPLMRRAFYALPPRLRSAVAGLVLRSLNKGGPSNNADHTNPEQP